MIELSLQKVADITGGRLVNVADPAVKITAFPEFDSRKVTPGGLFIALPGAQVDGHDFAEKAVEQGAVAVLAAREVDAPAIVVKPTGKPTGDGANADIYAHDEDGSAAAVVAALADIARYVTQELANKPSGGLRIVGITGSAGKTSTKDLIASVLKTDGETVAPPGSFNNEIGHPYTALRCDEHTKYLVAELSARGIGHIRHLASIAAPQIGVVLNVGSAHLGEFGSRENIAKAKGELVEALPTAEDGGVAVLNADDPFVAAMAPRTQAKVVTYSTANPPASGAQYYATDIVLDDVARASFNLHTPALEVVPVKLQVFGAHQVSNALAAVAVAVESGLSIEQIVQALNGHTNASAHRMDVNTRKDGLTVINDSYNANPDSMRAAVAALGYTSAARPDARAIAVLGEMGELGDDALEAHTNVGHELAKYNVSHLIAVGNSENIQAMVAEAEINGVSTKIARDVAEATALVNEIAATPPVGATRWGTQEAKDVVLLKASNAEALWRVADMLLAGE